MLALAAIETTGVRHRNMPFRSPEVSLDAKEVLFTEYDAANYFYIVKSGLITEYRSLIDGQRQVLAIYFPGDMVGISPSDGHETAAEATCASKVEAISRKELSRRLRHDENVRAQITEHFLNRLINSQAHILLLGRMTAVERVASFIYQLSTHHDHCEAGLDCYHIPMTRGDIADYLGLSMETVSRAFSNLKWRDLIALPKADVVKVLDSEGLAQLAFRRYSGGGGLYHA